jgi:phosphoglucosamine mutase
LSTSRNLFGTDGVRGVANDGLTPELALSLGRALGARLGPRARVLVGRDTRLSGPMLEGALAAGLASAGADVVLGGVLPTPAIAELVVETGASAGVVISASHNPFPDNGIKLFGSDGFKLPDAEEAEIEQAMAGDGPRPVNGDIGHVEPWGGGVAQYLDHLLSKVSPDLSHLSVALDCANGATFQTAPEALGRLGAKCVVMGDAPDGVNINAGCGSTHLDALQRLVVDGGHHLGLAFDGDGDRVLAVDATGAVVDGDQILAVCALWMREKGLLAGDAVVTTTMTNLGFRRAMSAANIEVRWTDVGDRYVLEEMRRGNYVLGGEQSGHLINLLHGPTGDGLAAGLTLLAALADHGEPLDRAAAVVQRLPQKLVNVRVEDRSALAGAEAVWQAVAHAEAELGDNGRVVLRASGTESLIRVMVEAPTDADCDKWCASIAAVVESTLGASRK